VTRVTANPHAQVHTIPVMARRSSGVVLIVALLSWTVNQLNLECQGQHSRAAVVVLAGASPAYQPEPSPTRHSCCPRERRPVTPPSPNPSPCHRHSSPSRNCCSITHETFAALPPLLDQFSHSDYGFASLSASQALLPQAEQLYLSPPVQPSGVLGSSFTVLRL
jgi:hypothetical protein